MALVAAFLVFGVVVAIAAVVVVREAGRMTKEPPPVLFSMDEAYAFVVDRLPDIVAATLTPDDVRRILAFQWEYFRQTGVSANGSKHHPTTGVMGHAAVVGGREEIDYIMRRCAETGEEYLPEQVESVVDTQLEYLRAIGAMSTPAEPLREPSAEPRGEPPSKPPAEPPAERPTAFEPPAEPPTAFEPPAVEDN